MSEPIFIAVDSDADLADLVGYYETSVGRELQPGSVEYIMLSSIAYMITKTNSAIQDAAVQNLIDFAVGSSLDYHGVRGGVVRLAATAAITTLDFTLDPLHTGITIPVGTRIGSTDGGAVFVVTEDVSVAAAVTSASVQGECQRLGTSGNGYSIGSITNILDPQPYLLTATNSTATEGGAEAESDTALRTRIKLSVNAFSTAGPRQAYEFHALTASPSIVAVGVVTSTPGQVDVYPLMADGTTPSGAILSAVEDVLNDESIRPITDTVVVAAPTSVAYNVTASLTLYTGANGAAIQTLVEEAIEAYGLAKRQQLGQDLVDTQIIAAIMATSDEIFDLTLTGWSDVVIAATEYGLLGTVTVTIAGYTAG